MAKGVGVSARWSFQETWPNDPASVALARGFVVDHLETQLLWQLVFDVRLVVSELATNAVRHARTPFTVVLERSPDGVTLRVHDGSSRSPNPAPRDSHASSGRGLTLVDAYASAWGVEGDASGDGKQIWASFDLAGHAGYAGDVRTAGRGGPVQPVA